MSFQGYPQKNYGGIPDLYLTGQQPKHPHTSHLSPLVPSSTPYGQEQSCAVRIVSIALLSSHLPPFGDSLIVVWISIVLALLSTISTYSVHQNDSIWNVDRIDARDAWLYANPNTSLLMPADTVKIAHIKKILPPSVNTKPRWGTDMLWTPGR